MEEILKQILNKLDTLEKGQQNTDNKLDKMQADISSLKTDNKEIYSKLDMLINTVADVKEDITANSLRIQLVDNKIKAVK